MITEPVHQKANGKWAFWDESWANEFGDFNTQREAQYELDRYSKEYLGNPENLSGRTKLVCNVCKTDWTTPNNQVGCEVCGKGTYGYVVLKDPGPPEPFDNNPVNNPDAMYLNIMDIINNPVKA